MARRTLPALLSLLALGCPKQQAAILPSYSGPPKAYLLLAEAVEAEWETRTARRTDLFVTTESGDPIPAVVAVGEVGPISRQGGQVRLYGDEAGQLGWSVDNFLLLEVSDRAGKVTQRVAIGFQQGVTRGAEQLDALGGMKFAFEAGEVDLTELLPEREPFTLKATVLDVGGVGKVSPIFLILSAKQSFGSGEEELLDR